MTIQQSKLLTFIQDYIKQYGYSPTLAEMKQALQVKAASTVYAHLQNLIKGGYLTKDGYRRGYVVKHTNT